MTYYPPVRQQSTLTTHRRGILSLIFLQFSGCTALCLDRTVAATPIITEELPPGRLCCNNLFHSLLYCRSPLSQHRMSWLSTNTHNCTAPVCTEQLNHGRAVNPYECCGVESQDTLSHVWGHREAGLVQKETFSSQESGGNIPILCFSI